MKTVMLQNVARASAVGIPLALKSFSTLAFDGIKVIARQEPGIVFSKHNGSTRLLGLALALQGETVPQGQARVALQQAWLRRTKPYRWETVAATGYRHWGLNE